MYSNKLYIYNLYIQGSASIHQSILEELNEFEKKMVDTHDLIDTPPLNDTLFAALFIGIGSNSW